MLAETLFIDKSKAPGIDQLDKAAVDLQRRGNAIARYTRHILHNADAFPAQRVEQRAFSHIRPADDGDDGEMRHWMHCSGR